MQSSTELKLKLQQIHKKSYPAYKSLRGAYDFGKFQLSVDHVQGDPFASPSNVSVSVPLKATGFPEEYYHDRMARTALEDALLRRFYAEVSKISFQAKGSGKSGLVSVTRCGQEILERSAMEIDKGRVTVRFEVGFPANGRTINAFELEKILFRDLPPAVERTLYYRNWKPQKLREVYELSQDQKAVREELKQRNLTAFIADGSVLPRESGVSQKPMKDAVKFASPESCRITLQLPYYGEISGMGIPRGVTLIAGGGYHGKSTLLKALELGIYNHINDDGREFVITDDTAVKIRAEDGRSVRSLDLSLFIHDLPNGRDPSCFSTEDASGSTSQAAAVIEGAEAGCRTFLIDEDTSATNFLVRDEFMQRIVNPKKEPITPFLARVRELYEQAGISTVLVAGSSGAFFHMADLVIQMDAYRPEDVTTRVNQLLDCYPLPDFGADDFKLPDTDRCFQIKTPEGRGRNRESSRIKIRVQGTDGFSVGFEQVDLRYVEQLINTEQVASLAGILKNIVKNPGTASIHTIVKGAWDALEKDGFASFLGHDLVCGYAKPRIQDIYMMLDRYRG
ncbi:Predicted ATPase of the ABC class [uncultured Roseburia sp.]|uniref:ABC-ATPase domain-containing protein n=1 Tax=Brotonthovivens ammoniilytica TaxID=2981725 RepID=A0ABT2TJ05_9FIRM|nr:ABC-ATPase domain-containing protein [Brotonthovivens ammoniilytica]MCU6762193.1 ABC-ATPase domain-containing protein [Brotonthovivens ammoniilytica]SCI58366.1 Predicted ATPase of the ABC class [uncultured Roseburia sp.]